VIEELVNQPGWAAGNALGLIIGDDPDAPSQAIRSALTGTSNGAVLHIEYTSFSAYSPDPADGAVYEDTWASLAWGAGETAVTHDVYMSDSFDDVNDRTAEAFLGNQPSEFLIVGFFGSPFPDGLVPGTTYYWAVDEVEADGTTKHKGPVWSFWIPPTSAYDPSPSDGGRYVDPDVTLSWTAGLDAKLHNVYFGDNFDDVNNATVATSVPTTAFTPGTLEKDKTYYWRVDEFNPPFTVKGDVWSFTTLPDIPIVDPNLVAWYKFEVGEGKRVIDFSGHDNHGDIVDNVLWVPGQFNLALEFLGDDQGHVDLPARMVTTASGSIMMWVNTDLTGNEGMFWYGTESGGDGFGGENEVHIHNQDAGTLGFGMEGSTDVRLDGPMLAGAGWNHVAATWDTVDGCRLYFNGAQVDFQTHTANIANLSTIRLGRPVGTGNGNRYHDGLLDDVRLFDHAITAAQVNEIMTKGENPRQAGAPSPGNGSMPPVNVAATLTWSAGEGAAQHDVYFGADKDAVADADASDATGVYRGRQNATSYAPDGITMDSGPFYWRIDEVANDGTIVAGGVWSFSVTNYALVDDFEPYNDIPVGEPGSNLVYVAWADGFDNPAVNGSTMGYATGESMETGIVHGGNKSVPFQYNNTTAGLSEVVRTFTPAQDWTAHGVITLSLWFFGDPTNVPGQLYVKVNGVQVNYDGLAGNLAQAGWQVWNIDLTSIGTNLNAVTKLAIGVQGPGATGTLLLDDIRLYALAGELVTPVQPNPAGLVGHWALDGDFQDSSGLGNHGTSGGNPTFSVGAVGTAAVNLDGDDYIAIDGVADDITTNNFTVSAWVKTTTTGDDDVVVGSNDNASSHDFILGVANGNVLVEADAVSEYPPTINNDQWYMLTYAREGNTANVYVNGFLVGTEQATANPASQTRWSIGQEWDDSNPSDFYTGMVDDVRIYNYPLSYAEVAGLAGRTQPFDKPF
ncbi:MAG: LamG domain-containing protein, partial [Phycisphaerales bacterium]